VTTGILDRVNTSVRWRDERYVEMHGNLIQHLPQRSQEHSSYLSRHWVLDTCKLGLLCSFKWVVYPP
jgi:hypothetical protein